MKGKFTTHTLSNGLKIVIEQMPGVSSVAAGILVRTGARDETRPLAGVSHFLEHMCFKGTPHRTTRELSLDFDRMGGQPNAFTSQERTFYHGQSRGCDLDRQIELLADMMGSTLPAQEFDREKQVVLEEIAMSQDRIENVAFDLILEKVFQDTSLSWPVLGYQDTVSDLPRDQMIDYLHTHYVPSNMVLIVAGDVEPARAVELAQQHCGGWATADYERKRLPAEPRTGTVVQQVDRFQQQIVSLVFRAPGGGHADYETAQAVATILGGDNSRFFWEIVQTGLCPFAGAWHLDYAAHGLMILYGQTEPDHVEKMTEAMQAQARRIGRERVSAEELQRVKNKRRTSLAVEGESPYHRLVQILDDVDNHGEPLTVEQRLARVEAITAYTVADYLQQYPIDGDGYLVSVGARDWPMIGSSS
ncbi:MAG: insulinase family protein [Planctomycetes bacterium]|nr:insulinase family protein [Planctomycetota bacterium]